MSDERILITSAHVIIRLACTELQSRGQLATAAGVLQGGASGLLSACDTGTVESEAAVNSMLWLGWRQVHKQKLKLYSGSREVEAGR